MVSRLAASTSVRDQPARARPRGVVLPVPQLSQMVHEGHFPAYGGGGEAWCSPTSTAMVLGYYEALPSRGGDRLGRGAHADRVVDHVARMTFDYGYDGTGNWPFNTAYAATRTDKAFVTRFASLRGVERLVQAGHPGRHLADLRRRASSPARRSRPPTATCWSSSASPPTGDVVVNDPAASSNAGVRRTYDRGQFENAWLKRGPAGGSGGIAYVIHDRAHPLPARNGATSW